MTKEQELEQLRSRIFSHGCKDSWSSEDYRFDRQQHEQEVELMRQIKEQTDDQG